VAAAGENDDATAADDNADADAARQQPCSAASRVNPLLGAALPCAGTRCGKIIASQVPGMADTLKNAAAETSVPVCATHRHCCCAPFAISDGKV
jgi:hypothetical protein